MRDGTGLKHFSELFHYRFFDVGIAEQHAVTLAAGMAKEGLRPVFAVYSTFFQRAYDQVLHDVCLQKLPVIFAIDRAGLVGEDGETHQGIFDLSYLSHIPNIVIMAPKCTSELDTMLKWSFKQNFPIAIRYPRGGDSSGLELSPLKELKLGRWEIIHDEGKLAIIATGKMVQTALKVREKLKDCGIEAKVINGCFVKPVDYEMIKSFVENNINIVTLEDNMISGGFGIKVLEEVKMLNSEIKVLNLGFKDEFISQGKTELLFKSSNLDVEGITRSILEIV